jgi:hypothetical protein
MNRSKKVSLFASDKEILSEAKRYLNSPIVDSKITSKELTDKIVTITKSFLMVLKNWKFLRKN